MKPRKKIFRHKLSFDKAELVHGQLALGAVGVSMPVLSAEEMTEYKEAFQRKKDWLQFGWMGNDPKFDSNITVSDIMPKPEDFVEVPFRLISATIVGGGSWKATDFSNAKILKKSTNLLDGKPLYKDHETDLDNWVGLVNGVKWTNSFTNEDGTVVPAGIDGILAIDSKTNPKVARGVLLGSVYSNSVTVDFGWEMSHAFENEWDFLNKIGTIGSDGKMIRRVVTEIYDYYESSLVWLGADPFAKAITEEGNLKHIDKSSIYEYSKSKTSLGFNKEMPTLEEGEAGSVKLEGSRKYVIDFGVDRSLAPLTKRELINNKKETDMDKKFILAFVSAFGKDLGIADGSEPTAEEMIGYIKKLSFTKEGDAPVIPNEIATKIVALAKGDADEVPDLGGFIESHSFVSKTELAKLTEDAGKVEGLNTKVAELTKPAEIGSKYLGLKRDEAIRLYKASVGTDKAVESVITLFKEAEDEAIDGLLAQYTKSATEKFSGTCKDCGSHEFKFQSSFQETGGKDGAETTTIGEREVSVDALYAQFDKPTMHIGSKREEK